VKKTTNKIKEDDVGRMKEEKTTRRSFEDACRYCFAFLLLFPTPFDLS
jgi:hypothetical protein